VACKFNGKIIVIADRSTRAEIHVNQLITQPVNNSPNTTSPTASLQTKQKDQLCKSPYAM